MALLKGARNTNSDGQEDAQRYRTFGESIDELTGSAQGKWGGIGPMTPGKGNSTLKVYCHRFIEWLFFSVTVPWQYPNIWQDLYFEAHAK